MVLATSRTCWRCGQDIDMSLEPNDRMSATVDHVIPLAMGGPPLDVANLRPAHRACNSARGARMDAPASPRSRIW